MSPSVETMILSLGTGLVILAIGLIIPKMPKSIAVLLALGFGMLAFVLWPRAILIEVPDLANLSSDEAEVLLSSRDLEAKPQPQEARNTRPHYVIPSSQNPLPGTKVKRGTIVRFSVSNPTSVELGGTESGRVVTGVSVSIFSPGDGDTVTPRRGADNIFRFDVEGTMDAVDSAEVSLLLWLQPIDPPSDQPGWYLQRLPANGIKSISGGSWRGVCQIGNFQWPPHDGDIVDVAVTLVASEEALRLQARQGPLTVVRLPGKTSEIVRLEMRLE